MANGYIDLPIFGSTGSGGGGGSGTVTSVDMVVPTGFNVTGNPITTAGTLTIGLDIEPQSTVWAASSTTSSVPSFRKLNASDINGLSSGTVTSVGVNLPSIFSTSGSPVTTSGTIGAILVNEPANTVFAGPNGSTGVPTFRSLVGADVPAANLATTGNGGVTGTLPGPNITPINLASNGNGGVTGTLAVTNGGTASSTGFLSGAALLGNGTNPYQIVAPGSSGTFLGSDGTTWAPRTVPVQVFTQVAANLASTGNGGVTGTLPQANGGTGLSASGSSGNVLISNGTVWQSSTIPVQAFTQVAANLASTGNGGVTGVLPVANGGTSLSTLTANNVILGNGTSSPLFVAPGSSGNVLTSNGTTWISSSASAPSVPYYISSTLTTNVTALPSAPGEYRTFQKTAASDTGTDDAPTLAPGGNGMKIYAVNYASAGASGDTNRWVIYVGQNKRVQFEFYANTLRSGNLDPDVNSLTVTPGGVSNILIGTYYSYDPGLGVAVVDTIQQASVVTVRVCGEAMSIDGSANTQPADCYFDILVTD